MFVQGRKDDEKDQFDIDDFDNLHLSVIRDRQRPAKRPGMLLKQQDEVAGSPNDGIAPELFYQSEQFSGLAHLIMV